jgi:hypothetical protein
MEFKRKANNNNKRYIPSSFPTSQYGTYLRLIPLSFSFFCYHVCVCVWVGTKERFVHLTRS